MAAPGPGRDYRQGISLIELAEMFPNEAAARTWFENQRWPEGVRCARCDGSEVADRSRQRQADAVPLPPLPRVLLASAPAPSWSGPRSRSRSGPTPSTCAPRASRASQASSSTATCKITQKSAWFMAHRIRRALTDGGFIAAGPVEADETFVGGKEINKHADRKLRAGRGKVGKTPVAGVRDRATGHVSASVVPDISKATLATVRRIPHGCGRDDLHGRMVGIPRPAEPHVGQAWRRPVG